MINKCDKCQKYAFRCNNCINEFFQLIDQTNSKLNYKNILKSIIKMKDGPHTLSHAHKIIERAVKENVNGT